MAMIKCRECGADISDNAEQCPYCGCHQEIQQFSMFHALGILFFGVLSGVMTWKEYTWGDTMLTIVFAFLTVVAIYLIITYVMRFYGGNSES